MKTQKSTYVAGVSIFNMELLKLYGPQASFERPDLHPQFGAYNSRRRHEFVGPRSALFNQDDLVASVSSGAFTCTRSVCSDEHTLQGSWMFVSMR